MWLRASVLGRDVNSHGWDQICGTGGPVECEYVQGSGACVYQCAGCKASDESRSVGAYRVWQYVHMWRQPLVCFPPWWVTSPSEPRASEFSLLGQDDWMDHHLQTLWG